MRADAIGFIEKMGLFMEADGVPRISGRILGFLLLSSGPCSLDDIAEELQVSKASVSTNARLLEGWGGVERVSRPGDRRDYYQIADDMQERMMERLIVRMRQMREIIAEGMRTQAALVPPVQRRLRVFDDFHAQALEGIGEGLRQLRAHAGKHAATHG